MTALITETIPTNPTAAFEALISHSSDLCRLNLVAGIDAAVLAANQEAAFLEIGFDAATAKATTQVIMYRALKGFTYSDARRTALLDMIFAETQKRG